MSSKRTVNRLGSLPWWMADSVRREPRVPRNVRQATLKERLSNTAARASTTYATVGSETGTGCRMWVMPS